MEREKPDIDREREEGPLGQLVDDKLNQPPETAPSELESPPEPRAISDDYAEGTAEHDDEDDA